MVAITFVSRATAGTITARCQRYPTTARLQFEAWPRHHCAGSIVDRQAQAPSTPGSLPFREERVQISWQRGSAGLPGSPACPATGGGLESPQEISGNAVEHE